MNKILNNKIDHIIVDQNATLFKESVLDFSFLSKCLEKKIYKKRSLNLKFINFDLIVW